MWRIGGNLTRRKTMSDAQKWSQERNFLVFLLRGTIQMMNKFKYSFLGEIGPDLIDTAKANLEMLLVRVKYYDSYSKVQRCDQSIEKSKEEVTT